MSARQEWHATLDDVLEGTHDDLEAIMISARYPAIDNAVKSSCAYLAPSPCLQGTASDWFFASCMLLLRDPIRPLLPVRECIYILPIFAWLEQHASCLLCQQTCRVLLCRKQGVLHAGHCIEASTSIYQAAITPYWHHGCGCCMPDQHCEVADGLTTLLP